MSAINDPLGQTKSPAHSDHYSLLNFLFCEILKRGTDVQTTRADIVITTGLTVGRLVENLQFRN